MSLKTKVKLQRLFLAFAVLVSVGAALTLAIIDGIEEYAITSHPVLTFFFILVAGIAVSLLLSFLAFRNTWHGFLGFIVAFFALLYAFIDVIKLEWWIILISMIAYIFVASAVVILFNGNKTEDLALNEHKEYKNYKERQAEKEALEAEQSVEPLPEIKTFKD